jgi:hypothetical protein
MTTGCTFANVSKGDTIIDLDISPDGHGGLCGLDSVDIVDVTTALRGVVEATVRYRPDIEDPEVVYQFSVVGAPGAHLLGKVRDHFEWMCEHVGVRWCTKHGATKSIEFGSFTGYAGGTCYFERFECGCSDLDESADVAAAR